MLLIRIERLEKASHFNNLCSHVLRTGVVEKKSEPGLTGEVECDEVYVVASHKGKPNSVKKRKQAEAQ